MNKHQQTQNEMDGKEACRYSEELLRILVSKEFRSRAIRIFKSIITAARKIGYDIETTQPPRSHYDYDCGTFFIVKGERIKVDIMEHSNVKKEYNGHYTSQILIPSGKLKFRIHSHFSVEKEIMDTPYYKLEDKIDNIIHSLEVIADKRIDEEHQRKIYEEQRRIEEERKRREEEERKRKEALNKEEREKVISLLIDVERYIVSQNLNEYIQAYQAMLKEKGIEKSEEVLANIKWMQEKSDWINPFVNANDDILTDDDFLKVLHPKEEHKEHTFGYEWKESTQPKYNYWQLKNIFGHK